MIITLFSYKGGVGKTTAAIHLTGHLNEHEPTALADGDVNRSAMTWATRGPGLAFPVVDEEQAFNLAGKRKNLVVDTPARPVPVKFAGLVRAADVRILVSTPDIMSLDTLAPAIADFRAAKVDFKVLLTNARPNTPDAERAERLLDAQRIPRFGTTVRGYVAARKAALLGCLVCDVDAPNAQEVWNDFGAIVEEIING